MPECRNEVKARERVHRFRKEFPEGSIRTFLVKLDEREAVFEARVFRTAEEAAMGIYTSGWAHAAIVAEGSLEGCESAAIARALANLGFAPTEYPARPRGARIEPPEVHGEIVPELARAA